MASDSTMGGIERWYDEQRARVTAEVRDGRRSASMSDIAYFPKPWADLDLSSPYDAEIVMMNLRAFSAHLRQIADTGVQPACVSSED